VWFIVVTRVWDDHGIGIRYPTSYKVVLLNCSSETLCCSADSVLVLCDTFECYSVDLRLFSCSFAQRKLLNSKNGSADVRLCDLPTVVDLLVWLLAFKWELPRGRVMRCYGHGMVVRSQLAGGVVFMIRFLIGSPVTI
jgi:hypothetical protein